MDHEIINSIAIFFQHSADQFERLLKEMCADDDGDLLIESAVKKIPKVFVVSTLVSVAPAQPFIFRNYQVCCTPFSSVFDILINFIILNSFGYLSLSNKFAVLLKCSTLLEH